MRGQLAERLLATVMGWSTENVTEYRPLLQNLAEYKYDSYQQYAPGMRFIESLALWLEQFHEPELREAAFQFALNRLVFFSNPEMKHFVDIAYSDHVLPALLSKAAIKASIPRHKVNQIVASPEFAVVKQGSLFLGLSDGARTDMFRRRAASAGFANEQFWQSYEVGDSKAEDFRGVASSEGSPCFSSVFLLDDFCGSGRTYLRLDENTGEYKGKIVKFMKSIEVLHLLDADPEVFLTLYVATQRAIEHLEAHVPKYLASVGCGGWRFRVLVVQRLERELSVNYNMGTMPPGLAEVIDRYYDPGAEDEHTGVGGVDVKYGFAGCGLPVSFAHNTPNNSIFLLWANPEDLSTRGLFPRVSRH